ncbi:hypothetical protein NDU88_002360, partial [Pleurodeles waltl]
NASRRSGSTAPATTELTDSISRLQGCVSEAAPPATGRSDRRETHCEVHHACRESTRCPPRPCRGGEG